MKTCKYCQKSIQENANKCYHCNEWQDERDQAKLSPPANMWSLITSDPKQIRRALGFFAGVVIILMFGVYFGVKIFTAALPSGSTVQLKPEGSVVFTLAGEKKAVFLLNPNGTFYEGIANPWISTGIQVKEGDKIQILASGRMNANIHHTVEAAQTDTLPVSKWSTPDGYKNWKGERNIDHVRITYVLDKKANYVELIAQISPDKTPPIRPLDIVTIGSERNFTATQSGYIYLTVNEIWLTTDAKLAEDYDNSHKAYAPDPIGNELYYIHFVDDKSKINPLEGLSHDVGINWQDQEAIVRLREKVEEKKKKKEVLTKPENDFFTCLDELANEGKAVQEKRWNYIVAHGYDNLWYDDNVGSFSISIVIKE